MKKIITSFLLLSSLSFSKEIILVQGAMDMEVDYLVKNLKNPTKEHVGSWTFWKGTFENHKVIVSRTEVGLVNAAAATTIGIERYSPTIIINQGTSGGHDISLHTGDIVLGSEIINIGAMRTDRKEEGVPENIRDSIFFDVVQRLRDNNDNLTTYKTFISDPSLIETAKNTSYSQGKLSLGTIGSADQWNREIERIKYLNTTFKTKTEEMESIAVAQTAKAYNIPFLAIRILSNTEIHNEEFNPKTALWCQEFTMNVIKNIK
ncbi:5'-methylthioadenosine/S-adenosylhomocysteine nucleosidase [Cetobacterium somerae]|uniref:5'-methylthioadenosine/S-adenosylhomocysteine nucleosidase n=1 Tax=Cetobacterium sp. NK01 TaxID=2993530 RepID=UPI002116C0FC|nr:5'-methylthioadenosine/S-adenosylhomocysteine nucleosidase [Cetobacterium sp. NK01]MCQ8211338.1 5'-methylthioadenosine/S-adenosylhomocysteine nucleosidase [Cetobacterium sp. NK01]